MGLVTNVAVSCEVESVVAKKNRGKRSPPSQPRVQPAGETVAAEFSTVVWMLTVMTALACELGAVAAAWTFSARPDWTNVGLLRDVLVFSSLVIGSLSLALAVIVWNLRRERPPIGITVFAVVVGVEPVLLMLGKLALR